MDYVGWLAKRQAVLFGCARMDSIFLSVPPPVTLRAMGRQWLHAKREVAGLKKGQLVGKLVKEIMVAAKLGGAEPAANPRLAAIVDKARKASVTRDVIERAIKKG